jgi:hypothetical protein
LSTTKAKPRPKKTGTEADADKWRSVKIREATWALAKRRIAGQYGTNGQPLQLRAFGTFKSLGDLIDYTLRDFLVREAAASKEKKK